MITEYLNKIKVHKEVLEALPKTNPKTIKAYKAQAAEILAQYQNDLKLFKDEIVLRRNNYLTVNNKDNTEDIKKQIEDVKNNLMLTNVNCSSYQLTGLDKMLYKLGHFYNDKIDECNIEMKKIINVFKGAEIPYSDKTFNYSYYCKLYMDKFMVIDDNDPELLVKSKAIFDEVYWKCPDIIKHITLSFKYLYYENEKRFDKYYKEQKNKFKDRNLLDEYNDLKKKLEEEQENSRDYVLKTFLDDSVAPGDYLKENIDKITSSISLKEELDDREVHELRAALIEYKGYLNLQYIIDDIKKLYANKANYKGIYNKKKKEISKKNRKVLHDTKKVFKSVKRNNVEKIDYYNNLINNQLTELKELFKELELDYFLEKVALLNESSTVMNILNLALSNFNYLIELMKKKELPINPEIDKLKDIVYEKNVNLLNNIFIDDKKDLALIICNKYNLYGYKLTKEMLDISAIDNLIKNCNIIIGYNVLKKHNLDGNKLKFIKDSGKILEEVEK